MQASATETVAGLDAEIKRLEKQLDEVLSLLSVTFAETDAPSGEVLLSFSDGATVRLTVECLECQMADLGPAWAARAVPAHPLDEEDATS